jgi:hypothetical protein
MNKSVRLPFTRFHVDGIFENCSGHRYKGLFPQFAFWWPPYTADVSRWDY